MCVYIKTTSTFLNLDFATYLKCNDERIIVLFTSSFLRKKERKKRKKNPHVIKNANPSHHQNVPFWKKERTNLNTETILSVTPVAK